MPRFNSNPLSLSVPPRQVEAWVNKEMVGRDGGLADVSSRRRRSVNGDTYAGGLTLNDLKREPVSWGDFWGQYCEAAYSWPRNWADAKIRWEANLIHYLGNYMRVVIVCAAIVFYKRPVAAFGAFTSYQAREWFKEYKSSLGPSTPNQEAYIKLLDAVMLVFYVLLTIFTSMNSAIFLIALLSAAVISLHAICRWASPADATRPARARSRRDMQR
mmetsp:Transcript_8321/g.30701  ORF Transcript_8321/g.30701 Transcript_8321/m.30701 type:complete len:215 (+) Transcript_8321:192-836(+)